MAEKALETMDQLSEMTEELLTRIGKSSEIAEQVSEMVEQVPEMVEEVSETTREVSNRTTDSSEAMNEVWRSCRQSLEMRGSMD